MRKVVRRGLQVGALTAFALALMATAAFADTTYTISGHIGHASGDWAGSSISAVPYSIDASGVAHPLSGSTVATDGTYLIDGLSAGTYRVAFTDANRVYADRFYAGVDTSIGAGANVSVTTTNAVGIDDTVTALPTRQIAGHVHFVGASQLSGDIQAEVYSQDASGTWGIAFTQPVADDDTYDVHVSTDGTYTVGFSDASDLFDGTFYGGASTVDSATPLVITAPTAFTNVDATLTASGSTRFGSDPISTAIAMSKQEFADAVGGTVVIASADNAIDALTAAPLARALNAPVLLVHKNSVDARVVAEITRLDSEEAIVIGGTGSVSIADEATMRRMGVSIVRRLCGVDRYGTSVAIAQEMVNRGLVLYDETGNLMNIGVASGDTPNDALCAAPAAAGQQMPLVLIKKKTVPAEVKQFLSANETSATQVIAFGGTYGITNSNLFKLIPAGGSLANNVTRIGDSDVFRTSVAIANYEQDTLGWPTRKIMLATDTDLVDAVAAGQWLAANQEPFVLTATKLKKKKVAHANGYTHLSPATEVFISKQISPVIDPAGVGYSTADGADYSNVLRDFDIARVDALGSTKALSNTVWNFARSVARV